MRRSRYISALCLVLTIGLASCGTSMRSISTVGSGQLTQRQFIQAYKAMTEYPIINAKGAISLYIDYGEKELNLSGIGMRWYLERDKGFEVSVRPLSFMEAGRLSVAQDEVLLVDRMNQMYYHQRGVRRNLGSLVSFVGLDLKMVESAIQHRPFGFVESGASALERMRFTRTEGGYTFKDELRPGGNSITHHFDAGLNLVSTSVVIPGKGEALMTYSDFVTVGERKGMRPIPSTIQMEVKSTGASAKHAMIHFSLERIDTTKAQEVSTTPPSGYNNVTLEDIINILSKL